VAIVLCDEMWRYREPGGAVVRIALAVFTIAYVGLSGSFLAALRMHRDNETGMAALLSLPLVVKFADTGAYAVGRTLGRHKLTPVLSPAKTIEGALGGVLTACLVSWLAFSFLFPWLFGAEHGTTSWWGSVLYGLILALAGMLGDLAESLLKRDVGRKDSSRWLPGLGGVLDILDSVLLAAPPAYLCWAAGLVK
jgi:phosphatidate cytidylyltransferase